MNSEITQQELFVNFVPNPKRPDIDYVFYPRSVALVGISTDPKKESYVFLQAFLAHKYPGKIYPVNPKATELEGIKAYPSIKDVPGTVDYVIAMIPSSGVLQLVEDCISKSVKAIHFFTAGFTETGEDWGRELEEKLIQTARRGNIRVIGPNCMGAYCPGSGIGWSSGFPKESGPVGFVSQSGYNASDFIPMVAPRGIRFSELVSYGNASDLNESDFFEYCTADPKTKVIFSYIEGVKDGRRFLSVLKEATKVKPVILLKGGRTEAGSRAAASHTGSLAGADTVWDALCKQFNIVRVLGLEELADVLVAFTLMPVPKGRNAGVIGTGGGPTVLAADDCADAGLNLPLLPQKAREELGKFTPVAGTSVKNPVDSMVLWGQYELRETVRIVAECEEIDFVITHLKVDAGLNGPDSRQKLENSIDTLIEAGKASPKPLVIVLRSSSSADAAVLGEELQTKCLNAGLAVFPSVGRAAHAISRLLRYYENQRQRKAEE